MGLTSFPTLYVSFLEIWEPSGSVINLYKDCPLSQNIINCEVWFIYLVNGSIGENKTVQFFMKLLKHHQRNLYI
jgi:hypothetical protein